MKFPLSKLSLARLDLGLGFEVAFNLEMNEIEVMSMDGETRAFKGSVIEDILAAHEIEYAFFPKGKCILMINTVGYALYRIGIEKISIDNIRKLRRTDLLEEGFDYCFFRGDAEMDGLIHLCYEHGLAAFDSYGNEVWFENFMKLRVFPTFKDDLVVYQEVNKTFRYRKSDGVAV